MFWEGFGDYIEALQRGFVILLGLCLVFVPLGLWKAVEILLWVARHLRWE